MFVRVARSGVPRRAVIRQRRKCSKALEATFGVSRYAIALRWSSLVRIVSLSVSMIDGSHVVTRLEE